ncbi:MAG: phospholipase A2, partial [Methylococcales bacterium]
MRSNIKTITLIAIGLHSLNAAAVQENVRPYEAGSVYNLNNYLPWQNSGPEIVSYPIGCSVNKLADFSLQLFFPQGNGPFTKIFHAECVRHDLCYRHGYYTYEFTKNDCDDEFAQGLENRCKLEFSTEQRTQCQRLADILVLAARKFGHLAYHSEDYFFRDHGYYYEYLGNRSGQYALLWSLLDPKSKHHRSLYRRIINGDRPLPAEPGMHCLLHG